MFNSGSCIKYFLVFVFRDIINKILNRFKERIPPVSDRWLEPKQWTLADFVCKSDDSCRRSLTGGT